MREPQSPQQEQRYLRDVEDHLTQVTEQIDGFRQLLRDIMTVNATLVAQKQNEEMKALTEAIDNTSTDYTTGQAMAYT